MLRSVRTLTSRNCNILECLASLIARWINWPIVGSYVKVIEAIGHRVMIQAIYLAVVGAAHTGPICLHCVVSCALTCHMLCQCLEEQGTQGGRQTRSSYCCHMCQSLKEAPLLQPCHCHCGWQRGAAWCCSGGEEEVLLILRLQVVQGAG